MFELNVHSLVDSNTPVSKVQCMQLSSCYKCLFVCFFLFFKPVVLLWQQTDLVGRSVSHLSLLQGATKMKKSIFPLGFNNTDVWLITRSQVQRLPPSC